MVQNFVNLDVFQIIKMSNYMECVGQCRLFPSKHRRLPNI